jgi:formylglycine-generating enzyme required for sulfatase activity
MKLKNKFLLLLFFLILGSPAYAADWAPDSLAGMTMTIDGESNSWFHIEEDASGTLISPGELVDFKYTKTGPSTFELLLELSAVQQIKMSAAMTGPKAGNYTFYAIHTLPGHSDLGQELYLEAGFFEFVDLNPVVPSVLPSGDYSFTPSSSSTPHWKRDDDYPSEYDLNHSFRLDQDWHFEASSGFSMKSTLLDMWYFENGGFLLDPLLDEFIFDDFMSKNFSLNNPDGKNWHQNAGWLNNPSSYRLVYRKDGKKLSVSNQNISDEEWREVFEISFEEGYQSIVFHGSDGQTLRGKDAYPVEYSMPDGSILDLGEYLNADLRSLDQFFLNAEDYSNGETFAFKLVVGQDSLDQLGAETSEGAEVTNIFSAAGSDLGSGWRSIEWFGFYFPHSSGWFYHIDHGWIYSHAESLDSIWYWHQTYKWCWTNQTVYPWVWFHDEQGWKYYFKQTGNWMAPVTSTESDSQTQDSNNSIDNSSGSNSTSSFDPSNPPKTWTAASASDLEMIWVEPGTFMMGSPTTESGRSTSETQHQVTLTQGFYLGKYEVTQAQYAAVMTGNSDGLSATPSYYSNNPNRPVEKVSWNDIQDFLARLNQSESTNIPTDWTYVLPTGAQWEYACRAGTTTAYSWGDSISSSNANYNRNIGSTQDVGQYSPNAWGFFDMHGNVSEWIADWDSSSYYRSNAVTDPTGPASGSTRVIRGGSWGNTGPVLRSAFRGISSPSARSYDFGFRVGFQKVQ